MAGIKIYPSLVKAKASTMNEQLRKLEGGIETELTAMGAVTDSTAELQGRGWDSARSYVEQVQKPLLQATKLWISYQMDANDRYFRAGAALPDMGCLDEDELRDDLEYWQYCLEREQRDDEPDRLYIRYYRTRIKDVQSKLRAITEFVSQTHGIYDRAEAAQTILSRADTEIKKVSFDPTSNEIKFASVDGRWVADFERLRDLEKLKADGLTEEQLKEAEELGFTASEVLAIWEEMKEQEIKRADLTRMKLLGYDFGKTVQVWESLEGKEDHRFFACLMKSGKENYRAAFEIDPNDLSGQMTLVMADYARNLLDRAGKEAFIDFNNALLSSERVFQDVMPDGLRYDSQKLYRDVYLERMYAGSTVVLQLDTALLVGMEMEYSQTGIKPAGYEEAYEEYRRKMDFSGYWASQSLLVNREELHVDDHQFRIDDLIVNATGGAGLDYQLGYYSPFYMGWKSEAVDNVLRNQIELNDLWTLEHLKDLQDQRDRLWADIMVKAAEGTIAAVAAVYAAPEVTALISVLQMAKNGSATTVVGMDKLTESNFGKMSIRETNVAVQNAINFSIQMLALDSKITAADKKAIANWAGAGESYQVDGTSKVSFYSLYDPKAICNFYRLQEEGLGAMAGWNSKTTQELADDIRNGKGDQKIQKESLWPICADLLTGEYQVIREVDGVYQVDHVSKLIEALDALNTTLKFKDKYPFPGVGIHDSFFSTNDPMGGKTE